MKKRFEEKPIPYKQELKLLKSRLKIAENALKNYTKDIDAIIIHSEDEVKVYSEQGVNYLFRKIFEIMNQGALMLSNTGIILYANKRMAEICKVSLTELLGSNIYSWFGEHFRKILDPLLNEYLEFKWHTQETFILTKDGAKAPIYLSMNKLPKQGGHSTFCLMVSDLTNIKNTELLLDNAQKQRLALLSLIEDEKLANIRFRLAAKVFEKSTLGIVIADHNFNITLVNNAFNEIFGFTAEEILNKPLLSIFSNVELLAEMAPIENNLELKGKWSGEIWSHRKNKEQILTSVSIDRVLDSNNKVAEYIMIINDITSERRRERQEKWQVYHDFLTGLPNRLLFKERFNFAIHVARENNIKIALLYIDLDLFKRINDTLGHNIGDKLLVQVGRRISTLLNTNEMFARLSGDEFVILAIGHNYNYFEKIAADVLNSFSRSFLVEQFELNITASIGIAIYPEDGYDFETVLKASDLTMYQAKQRGRNRFQFTTKKIGESKARESKIENELFNAIEKNEFYLAFQPQVSVADGAIVGFEVLLRWENASLGQVNPAEFIPIAERMGQIQSIGSWVLWQAIYYFKSWLDSGFPKLKMSINISGFQFYQTNFTELIKGLINEWQVPANLVELELTENIFIEDPKNARNIMEDLRTFGIYFVLDDFGTGFSSLSYLKDLPFSKLKIDKSFIANLSNDISQQKLVSAIIAMAESFGLATIVEGIETKEQFNFIKKVGANEIQGYYSGAPMSIDELKKFVYEQKKG